jgi:hypothetical protein
VKIVKHFYAPLLNFFLVIFKLLLLVLDVVGFLWVLEPLVVLQCSVESVQKPCIELLSGELFDMKVPIRTSPAHSFGNLVHTCPDKSSYQRMIIPLLEFFLTSYSIAEDLFQLLAGSFILNLVNGQVVLVGHVVEMLLLFNDLLHPTLVTS